MKDDTLSRKNRETRRAILKNKGSMMVNIPVRIAMRLNLQPRDWVYVMLRDGKIVIEREE